MPRISFHSIRATLAEWRASAVLSAPTARTGVFIVRSTMSNSDALSHHHRKPGDDDAERHCRDAMRIRVFFHAFKKACLERMGGDLFAPPKREAERRTAHQFQLPRRNARAQPRSDKRDRSPFGAPPRSCAGNPTRPGPRFLEPPDANGRTLSGTSAASTSQSGTRRTGRCPSRLKAKSDELRPQEPHPLRQSASPVDVPYDERDGRRYSNPQRRCQRLFDLCRQFAGLRGAIAAVRKP